MNTRELGRCIAPPAFFSDLPHAAHASTPRALCRKWSMAAGHSRTIISPALMARVATRLRPIDLDTAQRNGTVEGDEAAAAAADDDPPAAEAAGACEWPPCE